MSLRDVLLSLLREPMSGSDLIQLFRGTIHHFWTTDLSQIYRALDALEKDACLTQESVPSPRGPARKVYRLTEKGSRRLAEWIRRPPQVPPNKFEYLAQLFSVTADDEPAERAREQLLWMREDAVQAVATLEAIDEQMQAIPGYPHDLPKQLFYPWLTLRHGLLRRRSLLQWIDESLDLLDRRPSGVDAADPSDALSDLMTLLRNPPHPDDPAAPNRGD